MKLTRRLYPAWAQLIRSAGVKRDWMEVGDIRSTAQRLISLSSTEDLCTCAHILNPDGAASVHERP